MDIQSIRLRPLKQEDKELLYEWITDRSLVILNSPYYPVSEADHQAWLDSMLARRSDSVTFAIETKDTNVTIGTCRLLHINPIHRSAELQIRIGNTRFQGKGHGSEAVKALCKFGFRDLNLHRICLHVFASNRRAIRAYEKCGFELEGRLRDGAFIDGRWEDVLVLGLLNSQE